MLAPNRLEAEELDIFSYTQYTDDVSGVYWGVKNKPNK